MLRVIDEFENAVLSASNKEVNLEHPESSVAEQNNVLKDLRALLYLVKEGTVVIPFKETGPVLVTVDTGEVMDSVIVNCLREAPNIGKALFTEFVRDRIETCSRPLSDVIPRACLLYTSPSPRDFCRSRMPSSA